MRDFLIDLDFEKALSPLTEAAAYEAIWDKEGATVRKISDFIQGIGEKSLSSFISHDILEVYKKLLCDAFKSITLKRIPIGISFLGEIDFPQKLLDAKYPTPLVYFSGAWDLVFSPSVAVVGTRSPSIEGIKRTEKLVKELINDNYTIVSGLAKGIDTVAHKTAIKYNKPTIAVIGTPLSECYPKENKSLQDEIARHNLVISQVPFARYRHQSYRLNRFFFPERNKTMSALTLATIIVEAGETSGSLIQAQAALDQNRKLFILDNCFQNNVLSWPKKFEEKGAIRVKNYSDIKNILSSS